MNDDKILKFPANQEVEVRLKSREPFWKGIDSYQKERYGYELHNDISGNEKFYCSQTCHELIHASGVKELDLFKMMLKNENNKSIWLLSKDGKEWKNKYQFSNETIENNNEDNSNESVNINTPTNTDRPNLADEIQEFKKEFQTRIEILEKKVQAEKPNDRPEPLSESEIPF